MRLFAVIRFESVIHEYDPYFNFRVTKHLTEKGYYEFWNWFDETAWYPLGRAVGPTLYPGLMTTAWLIHNGLNCLGFIVDIRDICVFVGPTFAGLTAIAAYLFTSEVTLRPEAGLLAALFCGMAPSYISRSVAGSYDNEAVAIFALVFSFYSFVRAMRVGSAVSGLMAAIAYFYMVASWGGYVFIINTIAIFMVALIILGRLRTKVIVVYNVFHVIGTLLCLNIPFVAYAAISSSEHLASHGVFLLVNGILIVRFLKSILPASTVKKLLIGLILSVAIGFTFLFATLLLLGLTRWSGRSMTLLDPTYAAKHIPIIASVSEHQATVWASYILDLHILHFLAPLGLLVCFKRVASNFNLKVPSVSQGVSVEGSLFLGIFGILSAYFSAVMIRLMLVLAPAAACLAAVGISWVLTSLTARIRAPNIWDFVHVDFWREHRATRGWSGGIGRITSMVLFGGLLYFTSGYVSHCVWSSSVAYSHPSIVIAHHMQNGERYMQDDFREAYYWMRKNTGENEKIMSWWDYGYQMAAMSNRTTLVDNNTWNNTHIATMGLAFASTEEEAYPILRKLDADYVLVVFGGLARYQSDDINKFLWMIRIASGVYPQVQEQNFYNARGQYSVGRGGSPTLLNSLMYKLSFYRVGQASRNRDYVRQSDIGNPDFKLKHFEEVFTSEHWIVRIYRVKKPSNRGLPYRQ